MTVKVTNERNNVLWNNGVIVDGWIVVLTILPSLCPVQLTLVCPFSSPKSFGMVQKQPIIIMLSEPTKSDKSLLSFKGKIIKWMKRRRCNEKPVISLLLLFCLFWFLNVVRFLYSGLSEVFVVCNIVSRCGIEGGSINRWSSSYVKA